jgi:hypothetical protein
MSLYEQDFLRIRHAMYKYAGMHARARWQGLLMNMYLYFIY